MSHHKINALLGIAATTLLLNAPAAAAAESQGTASAEPQTSETSEAPARNPAGSQGTATPAASAAESHAAGSAESQAGESSETEASNAKVVATVNGQPITETMVEQYAAQRGRRGARLNRDRIIKILITQELLAQAAEARQLDQRPEVAATVRNAQRAILAQTVIQSHVQDHPVRDEDVRKEYETQSQAAEQKSEYKARHILLEDEAKARSVIEELDAGGDFAALAKEHSTGPTGKKGGDLGWLSPGETVDPFAGALTEMEVGSYTEEPVQTEFGWHVIKLEDKRKAEMPGFDQAKGQIRQRLQRQAVQQYVDELRDEADIQIKTDATGAGGGESTAPGEAGTRPSN